MAEAYDVVIVGGAAVGASVAYHLLADPAFRGTVAVVERDPSFARAASALSAGGVRAQFSTVANIRLGLAGMAFLRAAPDLLAVDGERPDLGYREGGYLFLASPAGAETLAANGALQRAEGARVAHLDAAALASRFPWLDTSGLAAGVLGLEGEGWFDGWALLQALRRKARALGAAFVTGEAAGVETAGGRVTALRLRDGSRLPCGVLVNAAGAYGGARLAAAAGVALPVVPRGRSIFTFRCAAPLPGLPLLIDPSGVYVRPEGDGYLCGVSPAAEADPDLPDPHADGAGPEPDHALFEEVIWPILAARVPAFEAIRPGRAWAGPYDMNLHDANALLGPHPAVPNLHHALGFSGHGLQQAPAAGRALAELIAHGRFVTLDAGELATARLAEGRRVVERNVV